MTGSGSDSPRRVLVLAHTGREDAREVARTFVENHPFAESEPEAEVTTRDARPG